MRPKLVSMELEKLKIRLEQLEKQSVQDTILLIEIMSSATFFGEMKKSNRKYAKKGQCSFFFLKKEENAKLPIVTKCRINYCRDIPTRYHLELSNLTCTFCPVARNSENTDKKTKQTLMIG